MTQSDILLSLDCQRQIVTDRPHDINEKLMLESLYTALRNTFHVVPAFTKPQYVFSSSRAVLKRV